MTQGCEPSTRLGALLSELWGIGGRVPGFSARATRRAAGLQGEHSVCEIIVDLQPSFPGDFAMLTLDARRGILLARRDGPDAPGDAERTRELEAGLWYGFVMDGQMYPGPQAMAEAVMELMRKELRQLQADAPEG
jgi:hypothetical protein